MTNLLYLFQVTATTKKLLCPTTGNAKKQPLFLFVEKKIEIWHSLLRANTQSCDDATAIEKLAKTLATSGFLSNIWETFVPRYMPGEL